MKPTFWVFLTALIFGLIVYTLLLWMDLSLWTSMGFLISIGISLAISVIFYLRLRPVPVLQIPFLVTSGFLIGVLIRIVFDLVNDPGGHTLLGIEIAPVFLIAPVSLAGNYISGLLVKIEE